MAQQAIASTQDAETVTVILKQSVLSATSYRRNSPEWQMLQKLSAEPHEAYFEEDGGQTWCHIKGHPRILKRCFEVVG